MVSNSDLVLFRNTTKYSSYKTIIQPNIEYYLLRFNAISALEIDLQNIVAIQIINCGIRRYAHHTNIIVKQIQQWRIVNIRVSNFHFSEYTTNSYNCFQTLASDEREELEAKNTKMRNHIMSVVTGKQEKISLVQLEISSV